MRYDPLSAMELTVLVQRLHYTIGHAGPLVFNVAVSPPTVADIDTCEQVFRSVIDQQGPISILVVIRGPAGQRVSPEARARLDQLATSLDSSTLGHATVIEGEGLVGGLMRALIGVIALLKSSNTAPSKVFSNVHAALEWLAALPGQQETFVANCAEVEAELKRRARWVSTGST